MPDSTVMVWLVSLNSITLFICVVITSVIPPFGQASPRVTELPPAYT